MPDKCCRHDSPAGKACGPTDDNLNSERDSRGIVAAHGNKIKNGGETCAPARDTERVDRSWPLTDPVISDNKELSRTATVNRNCCSSTDRASARADVNDKHRPENDNFASDSDRFEHNLGGEGLEPAVRNEHGHSEVHSEARRVSTDSSRDTHRKWSPEGLEGLTNERGDNLASNRPLGVIGPDFTQKESSVEGRDGQRQTETDVVNSEERVTIADDGLHTVREKGQVPSTRTSTKHFEAHQVWSERDRRLLEMNDGRAASRDDGCTDREKTSESQDRASETTDSESGVSRTSDADTMPRCQHLSDSPTKTQQYPTEEESRDAGKNEGDSSGQTIGEQSGAGHTGNTDNTGNLQRGMSGIDEPEEIARDCGGNDDNGSLGNREPQSPPAMSRRSDRRQSRPGPLNSETSGKLVSSGNRTGGNEARTVRVTVVNASYSVRTEHVRCRRSFPQSEYHAARFGLLYA